MKGAIAAFLAAVQGFLGDHRGDSGTLSLLITGDEEGPAVNGTAKLLAYAADRGHRFDAAIVGEPTNQDVVGDTIKIGRRGSFSGTIRVTGRQGHAAYPERAANPLPGLIRLLHDMLAEPLDQGTDRFQPSNLEFTSVDAGNPAFNVIPAEATARFNIRFNEGWSWDRLEDWVRQQIAAHADPALGYALELEPNTADVFVTDAPAFVRSLTRAIAEVTGHQPMLSTGGGTSDARFIKDYCPVVDFGLVGSTMHQVDEHVPVADLDTLAAIYRRFLELFVEPDRSR
jgi:succinyl-diaminopimelate desuccinylase